MRTTLLEILMGLPPEQLTEGTTLEVEAVDGSVYTVTIGPRRELESALGLSDVTGFYSPGERHGPDDVRVGE